MKQSNKQEYKKLLLIISLFFIVAIILQLSYKRIIYTRLGNGYKKAKLTKINYKIKYLFLGDSHIQNSINPFFFKRAYNFASGNENFAQTYFKLKAVVDKLHKNPEIIILPIDISSFSSFRKDRFIGESDLISLNDWIDYYIQTRNSEYLFKYTTDKLFAYVGKFKIIYQWVNMYITNTFPEYEGGFKPRDGILSIKKDVDLLCKRRVKLYLKGNNYFDSVMVHYFINILEFCHKNDIEVILLKMPLSKEYVKASREYVPLEDYYHNITKITTKYDNLITLDYQSIFWNNGEYFRNPDHMNASGAKVFSELLSKDFKKIDK